MNAEYFHFLIPIKYRLRLEVMARQDGYSQAWLVRAILLAYQKKFGVPPQVPGRSASRGPRARFQVVFYGDKAAWFAWVRASGQEVAPVVRGILDYYFAGGFQVDFGSLESVKKRKTVVRHPSWEKDIGNGYAIAYLMTGLSYHPTEYRPINHKNNRRMMEMGLKNKKISLVYRALTGFYR